MSTRRPFPAAQGLTPTAADATAGPSLPPPPPPKPRTPKTEATKKPAAKKTVSAPKRRNQKPITLTLPEWQVDAVRTYAADHHMAQPQVVTQALSETYECLADLVKQEKKPQAGSLFTNLTAREEPSRSLVIRLNAADTATLDRLVKECGATSRSMVCKLALNELLKTTN